MSSRVGIWLACLLASSIACVGARPNHRYEPVDASGSAVDLGTTPDRGADEMSGGIDLLADARPVLPAMVGWWKLDDAGQMALDSSGQGNHGTVEGLTAGAWTTGRHAGAVSFPPGAKSAGIRIPISSSLKALRRITVAAWIRRLGTDVAVESQSCIVSQQDDLEPRAETFGLVAYMEDLEAFIETSNGAQTSGTGPLGAFGKGMATRQVWLHVAMTFDGAMLRLYRNGVEIAAAPITRPLALTNLPIYLGTNKNDHVNQPFEGLLDDVLICADALPASAIAALAAGTDPAAVCGLRP
jgi:hypothetical protein